MSELVAVRDLEKEYRGGPEVVRVLKGVSLSVAFYKNVNYFSYFIALTRICLHAKKIA